MLAHCLETISAVIFYVFSFYWSPAEPLVAGAHGAHRLRGTPVENHWYGDCWCEEIFIFRFFSYLKYPCLFVLCFCNDMLKIRCISWWTVTAYVYNTVYSELTACNPTLIRWLQHRYKQSRLCGTEQWPCQTQA